MNDFTGMKAALLGLAAILTASVLTNPTPSSATPSTPGPSLVSVAPNSSTGITQTFSLVYSDPNGISDLKTARVLFNASVSSRSACYVTYSPSTIRCFSTPTREPAPLRRSPQARRPLPPTVSAR